MSELTDKLLKVASDIDSLIEKIASETPKENAATRIKTATMATRRNSEFGTVSDYSTKSKDPLLDFILS